jgi:hypothetical protein
MKQLTAQIAKPEGKARTPARPHTAPRVTHTKSSLLRIKKQAEATSAAEELARGVSTRVTSKTARDSAPSTAARRASPVTMSTSAPTQPSIASAPLTRAKSKAQAQRPPLPSVLSNKLPPFRTTGLMAQKGVVPRRPIRGSAIQSIALPPVPVDVRRITAPDNKCTSAFAAESEVYCGQEVFGNQHLAAILDAEATVDLDINVSHPQPADIRRATVLKDILSRYDEARQRPRASGKVSNDPAVSIDEGKHTTGKENMPMSQVLNAAPKPSLRDPMARLLAAVEARRATSNASALYTGGKLEQASSPMTRVPSGVAVPAKANSHASSSPRRPLFNPARTPVKDALSKVIARSYASFPVHAAPPMDVPSAGSLVKQVIAESPAAPRTPSLRERFSACVPRPLTSLNPRTPLRAHHHEPSSHELVAQLMELDL